MKINMTCGDNILKKEINGEKFELCTVNKQGLKEEIKRLNVNKKKIDSISTKEDIELLDKCSKLWMDEKYAREHIKILSKITNQSYELVSYELKTIMKMLSKENIEKTIEEELGNKDVLDKWVETSYGYVRRHPRGVVFHNISGNAFVVPLISIAMGLVSRNCNIVKVSGDEPYFAYAFYKSLCEIDEKIKERLSVVYFDSSKADMYEAAVSNSDCVIHWGGEYSGKIMRNLCAKYNKHLILHGPKISFEVIDETENINKTTQLIANDIIFWEQKACLSPRIVFINENINKEEFSKILAESLYSLTNVFPKAYMNTWNSMKTIQDRQYCILKYGLKEKIKVYSSYNADYTVILNDTMPDKEDIDKCFYRFIFICPYSNNNEVYDYIEKNIKQYLQTMGYNGHDNKFIEKMTLLGVSIVTKPGDMAIHYPGTSHDGMYNLHEMTIPVSRQL